MIYPNKIQVPSDGDELLFTRLETHDKKGKALTVKLLYYTYTKSSAKLNILLPITLELVNENLLKGIFKEIK